MNFTFLDMEIFPFDISTNWFRMKNEGKSFELQFSHILSSCKAKSLHIPPSRMIDSRMSIFSSRYPAVRIRPWVYDQPDYPRNRSFLLMRFSGLFVKGICTFYWGSRSSLGWCLAPSWTGPGSWVDWEGPMVTPGFVTNCHYCRWVRFLSWPWWKISERETWSVLHCEFL